MALSTPYIPTGEFEPEREWSCPIHDYPVEHHCDCHLCTWEEPECCANADWADKLDADGNVVMRELTSWDLMFRKMYREIEDTPSLFASLKPGLKFEWVEDALMPRIGNGDG